MTQEEIELLEKIKQKKYLVIVNKMDLEPVLSLQEIDENHIVRVSVKEQQGIEELKKKMVDLFLEIGIGKDLTYLTNARSIALLKRAYEKVQDVEKQIDGKSPVDMLAMDIREIWDNLGEIIGETYEEELIDELFSRFCLGK